MFVTFDFETTYGEYKKRASSPFYKDFKIIIVGIRYSDEDKTFIHDNMQDVDWGRFFSAKTIIGQNIKFDLLWLMRHKYREFTKWVLDGGDIYDTALAEYLLSGHVEKYPSLNTMATKYGFPLKNDIIKEMWEQGIDIAPNILSEYCIQDVDNTLGVALKQVELLKKENMFILNKVKNGALLYTTYCEWNGMHVDKGLGLELRTFYQNKFDRLGKELLDEISSKIPKEITDFNIGSGAQLSALLFGGNLKYVHDKVVLDENGEPVIYKSGQRKGEQKTKKTEETIYIEGYGVDPEKYSAETKKLGVYKTSKDVITNLQNEVPFIPKFQEYNEISTILSTYLAEKGNSVMNLVHDHDNCVHGSIGHVGTVTGRNNSRAPNLQNQPNNSEFKRIFTSRYTDGHIINADYSQLEIIVLAWLSQDDNLINDIIAGIDFHCKRLAYKEKMSYEDVFELCKVKCEPVWEFKRKKAKQFSFQQSYGGGAKSISESIELPIEEVKALMDAEAEMYPGVRAFHDMCINEVEMNARPGNNKSYSGIPVRTSHYRTMLTNKFSFVESEVPESLRDYLKRDVSFKPTEIKNYKVQGTAGNILEMAEYAVLLDCLKYDNEIKVINTVHDALTVDASLDYTYHAAKILKRNMEAVPNIIKDIFGVTFNLPLKVDISIGNNWLEQKEIQV